MDTEEATVVLKLMAGADDGCGLCGADLWARFVMAYPQFTTLAGELAEKELGHGYGDGLRNLIAAGARLSPKS